MKKARYIILILLFTTAKVAQAQTVEVSMNRNSILIGQQISLGFKVNLPSTGYRANFSIPDSVQHFEILRKDEVKAVKGENALEQVITFTSFDSGSWYFPALPVLITDGARKATIYSDSIRIEVGYSPADSSGQLRDVKQVMDVKIPDYTIYYIIGAILLLLLIAYLLYRYFKNRKNKPAPLFRSDLAPYEEAMQSLQELESGVLLSKNQEKEFHTTLANIFKRYHSRKTQRNLLNKTTGDILLELKENDVDAGKLSDIASALRYTDAVKFAKFKPLHSESNSALLAIKDSIKYLENRSPLKS